MGALYKLAYSSVVFVVWVVADIPHVLFGAVFLALMVECLVYLRAHPRRARTS